MQLTLMTSEASLLNVSLPAGLQLGLFFEPSEHLREGMLASNFPFVRKGFLLWLRTFRD